jgi:hypothetical protein
VAGCQRLGETTAIIFRIASKRWLSSTEPHKTQKPIKLIRFFPAALWKVHPITHLPVSVRLIQKLGQQGFNLLAPEFGI